jgi:glycosyltransferase involved in cell wall biosynthesis
MRRRHRLVPRLARRFYPWADAVVAVSHGAADDLARTARLARAQVRVIHNPIVTPELREMTAAVVNHPWFQPDAPPVVVAVGRLAPQKDFETLIRALSLVRREGRPARLLILGEGSERSRLEALTTELGLSGVVEMPGWVQNPYPYMVRAAAFVLSSRWEGLPSVLIEALFCGPPIISTNCPSGPVEILDGGRHGSLVPVGDATALAEAIGAALSGDVRRPSHASWRPYAQETVVTRYLEVLTGS